MKLMPFDQSAAQRILTLCVLIGQGSELLGLTLEEQYKTTSPASRRGAFTSLTPPQLGACSSLLPLTAVARLPEHWFPCRTTSQAQRRRRMPSSPSSQRPPVPKSWPFHFWNLSQICPLASPLPLLLSYHHFLLGYFSGLVIGLWASTLAHPIPSSAL